MNLKNLSTATNPFWFKNWFDSSFYHQLYAHRDENEARTFIDSLLAEFQPSPNAAMLDLGCGAGRHAKYLASKGYNVTGIDLSFSSIKTAQKYESSQLRFYRADMRTAFGHNLFDYVFNFFTSFGYFTNMGENNLVLQNISNALKPGGKVVIDYLNVAYSEERIVASERKEIDGVVYDITRWHNESWFFKKIRINDMGTREPVEFTEQVSKFRLHDFEQMLQRKKLCIEKTFGSYALDEYNASRSPRLILIISKEK